MVICYDCPRKLIQGVMKSHPMGDLASGREDAVEMIRILVSQLLVTYVSFVYASRQFIFTSGPRVKIKLILSPNLL